MRYYVLVVIASAVLRSNPDLNVDKYLKKLIRNDSNSTLYCLSHRYVGKNVRKVGIAYTIFGQGLLRAVRTSLNLFGILAIRDTRWLKFCQRQTIVGC